MLARGQVRGAAPEKAAGGIVGVVGVAAQLVAQGDQLATGVVAVAAVDGVVAALDEVGDDDVRVVQAGELVGGQAGGELPGLATEGVVAGAAGQATLGAQDLAVSRSMSLTKPPCRRVRMFSC
ncbi:hypothetical protein [Brenneria sp. L3_3C_1]|uniref:hypothetical protein n=1 Tax=Brenneria sp. L3_3C_1 TaxID=3109059 RepID=UPI001F47785D|nr:hypothetical protein [Brenneria sp. L3-3C-1]MEE3644737.1 hypothetical protein [Brenneria sp. L3_3C_1]